MRKMAMAAVAVALLAAGCGGSEEPAAVGEVPPPSTTAATAPTSTTMGSEQAVLDAYLANWEAWAAATDPPDPDFPGLTATRTGPALQAAQDQITAWRASGRASHEPENSISENRVEVISVNGDEALVRDCSIDDALVVIAATGEVVNDQVETALFEGAMVLEGDRWKLQSLNVVESWEGVTGCAEE